MRRSRFHGTMLLVAAAGMFAGVLQPGTVVWAQGASSGAAQVSWVTVRDPREQAFSVEVPKGWKVYGGMFRFGLVDARPFVDATSPDGKINLRVGDATIPGYSTPNPWIRTAAPDVAPYASGDLFASKYGQARFASMCDGVQMKGSRPMPAKYHPQGMGMVKTTGGEAYFSCSKNGQAMAGYVYAETMLVGSGGANSKWFVVALGSLLAPVADGQAAGALLKHMGESIAFNPEWSKEQQARVDMATRILLGTAAATARATQEMNAHQQNVMKAQQQEVDNFNDVLNGVSFTRNPQTGQTYEVPLGTGGAKWMNGGNVVVESAMSPGAGFTQLQTISR